MIVSSSEIRELIEDNGMIEPVSPARVAWIEGCAFDLRLARVEKRDLMSDPTVITEAYRKIPKYIEVERDRGNLWNLHPFNRYRLTSVEIVSMPHNVRGEVQLRRTFPEGGLLPFCTGVAPGYMGTLSIVVYNVDPYPAQLGIHALFATLEFKWISDGETDPYKGPRQFNAPIVGKAAPT